MEDSPLSLGELFLSLGLDVNKFYEDLENLQSAVNTSGIDFNIKPTVDDLAFQGFNEQLNAVRFSHRQLQQYLDTNPIRLTIDKQNLKTTQEALKKLATPIAIRVATRSSDTGKQRPQNPGDRYTQLQERYENLERHFETRSLRPSVDDSELTDLNQHFALKRSHFDDLRSDFQTNSLSPKVDFSKLDRIEQRLQNLQDSVQMPEIAPRMASVTVDVEYRQSDLQPVHQAVNLDTSEIESSLTNSIERAFKQFKGNRLSAIFTDPLQAIGGVASTLGSGLLFSILQPIGANLGNGLSTALEKSVSSKFGSTELLGEKLGAKLGGAMVSQFSTAIGGLSNVIDQQIDRVQNRGTRKQLREVFSNIKALPGQLESATQSTIGQDEIRTEGLARRGVIQQRKAARVPAAREQAAVEWREAIAARERLRTERPETSPAVQAALQRRSEELVTAQQEVAELNTALQSARKAKAGSKQIAELEASATSAQSRLVDRAESLKTLQQISSLRDPATAKLLAPETQSRLTSSQRDYAAASERLTIAESLPNQSRADQVRRGRAVRAAMAEVAKTGEQVTRLGEELTALVDLTTRSLDPAVLNQQVQQKMAQISAKRKQSARLLTEIDTLEPRIQAARQEDQDWNSGVESESTQFLQRQLTGLQDQYKPLQAQITADIAEADRLIQLRDQRIQQLQAAGDRVNAASQAFKATAPPELPRQYLDVAQATLGRVDREQLPQVVVDEAKLKQKGAAQLYNPVANSIVVSREIKAAMDAGTMTARQIKDLAEELNHAADLGFGSAEGIRAAQDRRILREAPVPTLVELAELAPELGLYQPEDRPAELAAKVRAGRGLSAYQAQQAQTQALNDLAEFGGTQFNLEPIVQSFEQSIAGLQETAQATGRDVSEFVDRIQQAFDRARAEIQQMVDATLSNLADLSPEQIDESQVKVAARVKLLSHVQERVEQKQSETEVEAVKDRLKEKSTGLSESLQQRQSQATELLKRAESSGSDRVIPVLKKELDKVASLAEIVDATVRQIEALSPETAETQIEGIMQRLFESREKVAKSEKNVNLVGQVMGVKPEEMAALATRSSNALSTEKPKSKIYQAAESVEDRVLGALPGGRQIKAGMQSAASTIANQEYTIDMDAVGNAAHQAGELAGVVIRKGVKDLQTTQKALLYAQNQAVQGLQAFAGSEIGQQFVGAAGNAAFALGAIAKTGYQLASATESLALDMVPMGRSLKGTIQQTAIPAIAFGAATHFLPGGHLIGEVMTQGAQTLASPLLQGAADFAATGVGHGVASIVPNILGLQGAVAGAASSAVNSAVVSGGEVLVQAGTVVLAGKALTGAAGNAVKAAGIPQALPAGTRPALAAQQAAALPPVAGTPTIEVLPPTELETNLKAAAHLRAQQAATAPIPPGSVPSQPKKLRSATPIGLPERQQELLDRLRSQYSAKGLQEVAKRLGYSSSFYGKQKKEDLAFTLASGDFDGKTDTVLAQLGDSIKLKSAQGQQSATQSLPKVSNEKKVLEQAKTNDAAIRELYKQFQTSQTAERAKIAAEIATAASKQIAWIEDLQQNYKLSGKTAQSLNGYRTSLTQLAQAPAAIATRSRAQQAANLEASAKARQIGGYQQVSDGSDLELASLDLSALKTRLHDALADLPAKIETAIAAFAEIESQGGLTKTLKAAAQSDKGIAIAKDLAVNVGGAVASGIAGQHGAVAGLSGDLMGALAMRQGLNAGISGVQAYQSVKDNPEFAAANALKKAALLLEAAAKEFQSSGMSATQGKELFGDLTGFGIGNLVSSLPNLASQTAIAGMGGIPGTGAIAASLTVPQLEKLRDRIQNQLKAARPSDVADGSDLELAKLDVSAMRNRLNDKQRQLLQRLENQISEAIEYLQLAVGSDPVEIAGKKLDRSTRHLDENLTAKRNQQAGIVNRVDAESRENEAQQQQRLIDRSAYWQRQDFSLIADRGMADFSAADLQNTVRKNQIQIARTRRDIFRQEAEGGEVADVFDTYVPDKAQINPIAGVMGVAKVWRDEVKSSGQTGTLDRARAILPLAESLRADIRTSEFAYAAKGDQAQAKKLKQAGHRADPAIAGMKRILDRPVVSLNDDDFEQLKRYRSELEKLFKLLDRPVPGGGGPGDFLHRMIAGFELIKSLLAPIAIGFAVWQTAGQTLTNFGTEALAAAANLDRLRTAFDYASGSSKKGAENFAFVDRLTADSGTALAPAREGYEQILSATRNTSVAGEQTKEVFIGVQQAATVLGMSPEKQERAYTALAQIAQKGKAQAEELRGQLSETGISFSLVADSMGMSTAELNKQLELGNVTSEQLFSGLGKRLQSEFGPSIAAATKTATAAMNRFEAESLKATEGFGKMIQPAQIAALNAATIALRGLSASAGFLGQVAITVGLAVAARFISPLLSAMPALVSMPAILKGISAAMQFLSANLAAIGKSIAAFAAVGLAMEIVKGVMDGMQPTELGKGFQDAADRGEASFKRIADAAKAAKNAVNDVKPRATQLEAPSAGIDIGSALTGGAVSFKSDDLLKTGVGQVFGNTVLGGIKATPIAAMAQVAGVQMPEGIATWGEIKQQKTIEQQSRFADVTGKLAGQVFTGQLDTAEGPVSIKQRIKDIRSLDEQLVPLQAEKRRLQGQPTIDKNAIKQVDERIAAVNAQRSSKAGDVNNLRDQIDSSIKIAKDALESGIDLDKGLSDAAKADLKQRTQIQLTELEQAKAALDKLGKAAGGLVDPMGELNRVLSELEIKLGAIEAQAARQFNRDQRDIATQQLEEFSTNRFASTDAAERFAAAEVARSRTVTEQSKAAILQAEQQINDPQIQQLLAGMTTTAGKSISVDSTIEEIEDAKKRTSGQADKDALDRLKGLKEAKDKLIEGEANLKKAELQQREAIQANYLRKFEDQVANEQARLTKLANDRAIAIKDAQLKLMPEKMQQARDAGKLAEKSFDMRSEDVGVAQAELQVRGAQTGTKEAEINAKDASDKVKNAQEQMQALQSQLSQIRNAANNGTLSAEEAARQQRDLGTQISNQELQVKDAQLNAAQAGLQKEEAIAKVKEAQLALRKAKQDQFFARLDRMMAEERAKLKQAQNNAQIDLTGQKIGAVRLRAAGAGEEDQAVASANIAMQEADLGLKASQDQFASVRKELVAIHAARRTGIVSDEKYVEKKRELLGQLSDIEVQASQAQLQKEEAIAAMREAQDRKRLARIEIEARSRKAVSRNQAYGDSNAGELTQAVLGREATAIDTTSIIDQVALIEKKIQANQNALAAGKRSAEEAAAIEEGLLKKRFDLEEGLMEKRIELQQSLVLAAIAAEKAISDATIAGLEAQRSAIDATIASIENLQRLGASNKDVVQSRGELDQAKLGRQMTGVTGRQGLLDRLNNETLPPQLRAMVEARLGVSGLSGQGGRDSAEMELLRQKQTIEDQMATQRSRQMEAEFAADQAALELDNQRNRLAAENVMLQAQAAKLQAEQNALMAQRNALDATAAKNAAIASAATAKSPEERAIAQQQVQIATQQEIAAYGAADAATAQIGNADRQVLNAQQGIAIQDTIAANSQEALRNRQQAQIEQFLGEEEGRKLSQFGEGVDVAARQFDRLKAATESAASGMQAAATASRAIANAPTGVTSNTVGKNVAFTYSTAAATQSTANNTISTRSSGGTLPPIVAPAVAAPQMPSVAPPASASSPVLPTAPAPTLDLSKAFDRLATAVLKVAESANKPSSVNVFGVSNAADVPAILNATAKQKTQGAKL